MQRISYSSSTTTRWTEKEEQIRRLVFEFLSQLGKPASQLDIRKNLPQACSKPEINKALYHDGRFVQTPGTPPTWTVKEEARPAHTVSKRNSGEEEDYRDNVYVFIDLGNVHEIEESQLEPYPYVTVKGFAARHYNGSHPKSTVRDSTGISNGAETLLSKSFNEIYLNTRGEASYVICSRNTAFTPYLHYYKNTKIVTDWNALKMEL